MTPVFEGRISCEVEFKTIEIVGFGSVGFGVGGFDGVGFGVGGFGGAGVGPS